MKRSVVSALVLVAVLAAAWSASAAAPFGGKYQATVKQAPPLGGVWQIAFTSKGGYSVTKKPSKQRLIVGTAKVSGNTIVFVDASGPLSCKNGTKGSYALVVSGKKLTLKLLKDPCPGRPLILAGGPFTKIG